MRITAAGTTSADQIAVQLGVSARTVERWRARPEWIAGVQRLREAAMRELEKQQVRAVRQVERHEIGRREVRLRWLGERRQQLADGLACILRERAADMVGVPGGASGLLCREYRRMGSGQGAPIVEQYRIDPGVLSLVEELREHERQAAQELGQWAPDMPEPQAGEDGLRLDEWVTIRRRLWAQSGKEESDE